jgi:hypothetical protein
VNSTTDQELAQALQHKHGGNSSSSLQGMDHEPLPSSRQPAQQPVRSPMQRQQEAQAFRLQMLQGRALQDLQDSLQQVAAALTASPRHPWQRQHHGQAAEHAADPSRLQLQPEASVASSSGRQEQEQAPQACQEVVQRVQEQQLPAMTRDQLHKWLKRKHGQLGGASSSGSRSPVKGKGSLAVALRAPPSATWPQRVTGAARPPAIVTACTCVVALLQCACMHVLTIRGAPVVAQVTPTLSSTCWQSASGSSSSNNASRRICRASCGSSSPGSSSSSS